MCVTARAAEPAIFDAHLHYSPEDAARLGPERVLAILDRNRIARALVSSPPGPHIEALHRRAPERILPFLSVYRTPSDKQDWMHDPDLPGRVERALEAGIYRGIGEIHIFAPDRDSPVLRRLVEIAAERGLVLQVHGDPAVIDTVFAAAPELDVLWAHMGTRPEPAFLREMLARHPEGLHLDTSVRDERIAPVGRILPEWKALFVDHPDRFMVGVDTHWDKRWERFDTVVGRIRGWLAQLPPGVAEKLAAGNARRLFGPPPESVPRPAQTPGRARPAAE